MKTANDYFRADMELICDAGYIPWERVKGRTVFLTGATGLIGYTLLNGLVSASKTRDLNLKILVLTRNPEKARQRFGNLTKADGLIFLEGTVEDLPDVPGPIDYIIHGASQTSSRSFIEQPVETIRTAVRGTENLLELARIKKVSGFVFLSSMEVYGHPPKGHKVKEDEIGFFSPAAVRNSYPIGKLLCENLCCSYFNEYGVPVKIMRLTQTFGMGVKYADSRIFAEFGRSVIENRDIILKTAGRTERSYLYTADAASSILAVLLTGENGEVYNAANEDTYCSIIEMAHLVAEDIALGRIGVVVENADHERSGYNSTLYMDLDTTKVRSLGWQPRYGLKDMYDSMIAYMKSQPLH